jgi:hypothetical protein
LRNSVNKTVNALALIRENLRQVAAPWKLWQRLALTQIPPAWMQNTDGLASIYSQQSHLLRSGTLTWGVMVQANMNLFKPGPQDHPAQTVYASNADAHPELLLGAARRLYQLKHSNPSNPEDRALAALISDEMDRNIGVKLPASFSADAVNADGKPLTLLTSAFMVFRAHLPGRTLRGNVFPLLFHPQIKAVMIVPQQFWPHDFQNFWLDR